MTTYDAKDQSFWKRCKLTYKIMIKFQVVEIYFD